MTRVITWNLEWASPRSWRTPVIVDRLRDEAPDVAVLTEARIDVVRQVFDHVVHPGPHPLSRQPEGSKVVIASNHSMTRTRGLDVQLRRTLDDAGLRVATVGEWPELADERPLIDHIAVSGDLDVQDVGVWPRRCAPSDSREVTDHAGVRLHLG